MWKLGRYSWLSELAELNMLAENDRESDHENIEI